MALLSMREGDQFYFTNTAGGNAALAPGSRIRFTLVSRPVPNTYLIPSGSKMTFVDETAIAKENLISGLRYRVIDTRTQPATGIPVYWDLTNNPSMYAVRGEVRDMVPTLQCSAASGVPGLGQFPIGYSNNVVVNYDVGSVANPVRTALGWNNPPANTLFSVA
jgi:hypothetical protein